MVTQRAADHVEVWAVVAEVVGQFSGPSVAVPVETGLPSIKESVGVKPFVFGLSFEPMPGLEEIRSAAILKNGPQVVDVATLASLDYASQFLGAYLGQRVTADRRGPGQISPCDDERR